MQDLIYGSESIYIVLQLSQYTYLIITNEYLSNFQFCYPVLPIGAGPNTTQYSLLQYVYRAVHRQPGYRPGARAEEASIFLQNLP